MGKLFDTTDFPARWYCGEWTAFHGYFHIISDLLVFGAYTAIPIVLGYFIWRRRDVPFPRIFWLFCCFIFACGTTHLIEAIIFWQPIYRFAGVMKAATAVVSWLTIFALIPVLPKALTLPGLQRVNQQLQDEIAERSRAEQELSESHAQLQRFHDIAVGREMRIIELKRQVNELAQQAGVQAPYDLSFADDPQAASITPRPLT